jgi:hypothetical protein
MAFQVSPNVQVQERDVSLFVPQVATTAGAFVGNFNWGPCEEFTTVDSEKALFEQFGRPDDDNFKYWFTAANFLSYGNNLQLNRVADAAARNAVAAGAAILVKNEANYEGGPGYTAPTLTGTEYVARYPGALGNSLKVSVADYESYSFTVEFDTLSSVFSTGATVVALTRPAPKGSWLEVPSSGGTFRFQLTADAVSGATTVVFKNPSSVTPTTTSTTMLWEFWQNVERRPENTKYTEDKLGVASDAPIYDELHVVVVDEDGGITGTANSILEIHQGLSKGTDAKDRDGTSLYYPTYINLQSRYIYWGSHTALETSSAGFTASAGTAITTTGFKKFSSVQSRSFSGGVNVTPTDGLLQTEYVKLASGEAFDVSLIPVVGVLADNNTARFVLDNVADRRRDCLVFVSPTSQNLITAAQVVQDRVSNFNKDSSFAVMDSGWKYQYDRYNDVYRWLPLCGDIAGCAVRTDSDAEPWFSPGGYARGQIKNVVKLSWNPSKTDRDNLYRQQINPVVSQPGLGTVLFGDKTCTQRPSAFDRINVRRLFIVLEKAVATAAKFQLFEFNDAFTRSQFSSLIEPFLRDVQGRRGITDFRVVCDETNNTGEVIDRNEFVADIYIKPNKSINFITLNFIATRSGVSFEEVGA